MWRDFSPLLAIRSPADVWATEPSYLVGEILFHMLFVCGFYSACKGGPVAAAAFAAALCGGAAIELATIMYSEVGNFYHGQAVLQLFGQHEPVYMLFGCYAWLSYVPMRLVSTTAKNLSPMAEAALGGLLLSWLWGTLDMLGLGYIWWTWHHGDPLYNARDTAGVPIASSFWIFSNGVCTVWLLRVARDAGLFSSTLKAVVWGAAAGLFGGLVLMNVPFVLIFHPVEHFKLPTAYSVYILTGVCLLIVAAALAANWPRVRFGVFLPGPAAQLVMYIATLAAIVAYFDPADVRRHTFGQPLGSAAICALPPAERPQENFLFDLFHRPTYLCPADATPAFDHFQPCPNATLPDAPLAWSEHYTLCGVAKSAAWYSHVWMSLAVTLAAGCFTACLAVDAQDEDKAKTD